MIAQLFAAFTVLVVWVIYLNAGKNFPPGPLRLPVLGHIHLLGAEPHKTLARWKSSYGPLMGVWFGSYRAVVINDTKLIKEAVKMNVFSGRPDFNVFKKRSKDEITSGFVFIGGSQWEEQRRFAIKTLHKFDFGTNKMETKIQECINTFVEKLANNVDNPIQVKHLFTMVTLNSLWGILFSETLSENHPDEFKAIRSISSFVDDIKQTLPIFLPWLAKIAPSFSGFQTTVGNFPVTYDFLHKKIKHHQTNYIENQPRDFVDAYIDQVRKTTNIKSSFHAENDCMIHTLFDLFLGGFETTSNTLSWLCAYLIVFPEVQAKLQVEIDEVVGRQRSPTLADRPFMHYTEAVINEVLRFSSLVPLAFFHTCTEDVEFQGFVLPKETLIVPNTYAIHFDEKNWGDPKNFRPERFIDVNGNYKPNENLLPFSYGKRVCIGETFAKDELFLITVNIFQNFSVSAAGQLPNLNPNVGFTLTPKPFEMIVKSRKQ